MYIPQSSPFLCLITSNSRDHNQSAAKQVHQNTNQAIVKTVLIL